MLSRREPSASPGLIAVPPTITCKSFRVIPKRSTSPITVPGRPIASSTGFQLLFCWPNAGNAIPVTINSPTKEGSTSGKFTNTPFRTPLEPLISALHENFCFEKIGSAEP